MSQHSTKSHPSSRANSNIHKELLAWFESLSNEEKCRITRVTSTDFAALISRRLSDLDLLDEIPNKPANTKKGKQKGDLNKNSEQSMCESLFDSLLVFSEVDFLDSIGLDFNLVKDSVRMIDILVGLSCKKPGYSAHTIPSPQQINSKQDVAVLVSKIILDQLQEARESQKFPSDQSWRRRDIGNYWSHLEPGDKSILLHLQHLEISELIKNLCKKGIVVSTESMEKEIRELMKLEKNEFCNRLLKCRLKKAATDPMKGYHRQLYRMLVERIKSNKKKKGLKKEPNVLQQQCQIFNQKEEEEGKFQKFEKSVKFKKLNLSPDSERKESLHEEGEQRVKSHSVSSNETNQTQSKLDLKYFGEDTFSKKIEALCRYKVANDLIEFGDIIGQKANSYQKYRVVAFNRIQYIVGTFGIQLLLFGSCANGLMIEKSDVDVAVAHHILSYFPYGALKDRVVCALSHLHQMLQQQPWVSRVTLITTASIPVLKLQIDTAVGIECPPGTIDENCTFKGYPDDSIKIEVDVTIDTSLLEGQSNHLGLQATQLMKNWMNEIPNLYSIAILLKYLFQKKELNSTYKGGLGSYCTMVMILAYLKHFKKQNEDLAAQMQGFLGYFCRQFDESSKGVDIANNVFFYLKESPEPKLQVKDPINGRIMTRNTYLYPKIKQQLMKVKKKCFQSIRNQALEHIGLIEDKEEREYILSLPHKEYFGRFQSLYSKNVFFEYEYS